MQIRLLVVGKTDSRPMEELISTYIGRIGHYLPFEMRVIPDLKRSSKLTPALQREQEGREILRQVDPSDMLILFDERGGMHSSIEFARYLERRMVSGERRMTFVIGGPYGFSDEVYQRANDRLSLSRMTFSHQMVRLFAVEQIYRAMTIIRGEPYHHE
ncbi:23S rRNA (pseudouridine(1915)-N(3))-methyltransferase RlmH [Porphyromonas sp. COT-239 OH1446]|uniref:23S rRNA (pseudouridine(1915)-N(3))-methyltransferase RlmH n=1 Tax=Porphyromonas sp. COT-239 OH1446 TaxID=1515613 RepID=UPI00052E07D8|nr:23S rRNA (pseudouridine(1915)-N(3))-methyltransferase RlmH [Porphyromonas sp. COT-239 OH1446]KGN68444.1 50S rRNA methyltransferase [Porphyromonas sp. COT-239 OH1446]